jgi:vacuolar-type H+-ATPase subunit I/STV1
MGDDREGLGRQGRLTMHILILVVIGHLVLALFVLFARLLNKSGHAVDGARQFIWVWLLASIANGVVGVVQAGIPLLNEVAAFVPIFGVPAAVAWYLSRRRRIGFKVYTSRRRDGTDLL